MNVVGICILSTIAMTLWSMGFVFYIVRADLRLVLNNLKLRMEKMFEHLQALGIKFS